MESRSRTGHSPLWMTRVASFVAVGLVAGLALSAVPNIELVTAVCFVAGFLLGAGAGIVTGLLTEGLFAGFHPMGSSAGVLLFAQMAGMSLAGLFGSLARSLGGGTMRGIRFAVIVTAFGILSTLIFDLLTNLAFPIAAGFSVSQLTLYLAAGIPFAAIHLAGNTLVFLLLVVPLLPRLQKALALP